jgi:diguanylate cyclase (GGDEF)-like protein
VGQLKDFPPPRARSDLEERLASAERKAARERAARLEAEAIAEKGLRELYDSQQQLLLLQRIAHGANQTSDVEAALRLAITEVCQHMGWAFGNALIRADDGALVGCDIWYAAEPDELFDFVELSRSCRLTPGEGLPGRVLTEAGPHWIEDVTLDANFPRASTALKCGLRAGCAFPVLVGDEVVAVLEFFSRKRLPQAPDLIAIMAQVGTQIGRVVERDRAQRALVHDALHDALTGLPNRVLFGDRLLTAFQRARDGRPAALALLAIDLDGFKGINDSLGHAAGDELLIETAGRIRAAVTAIEAASRAKSPWHSTIARMGGDEFTVLLDDLSEPDIAETVAEAIHVALRLDALRPDKTKATASIGVVHGDRRYTDVDQMLRDADLAMYEAKSTGRNRTVTFSETVGTQIRQRLSLEQQLREAIQHREFVLHYQPIVDLVEAGRICGFEALVRWNHPTRGLLPPSEFIAVAEETGLIIFLGDWVLRTACETLARWHRGRRGGSQPYMSINISPRQFLQPDFARRVRSVLLETGADPCNVRLEVTESVAILDAARTRLVIEEIRSWGVKTSLDDFGTGYSSLSHLQRLPFDVLKIDQSFVATMGERSESHGIIRAILDLARTMGMGVTAEGIETEEQAAALRQLGCSHGQGFFYGAPLSEADCDKLLRDGS